MRNLRRRCCWPASRCGSNRDRSASEDDSTPPEGATGGTTSDASTETYRSELFLGGRRSRWRMAGSSRWTVSVTWRPPLRTGLPRHVLSRPLCDRGGKRVKGVPATASGLFDALAQTRTSTSARRAGVDRTSPAVAADISASAEARDDDPAARRKDVCVLFIAFLRRWWAKATASR